MSYDFVFWAGGDALDPRSVYPRLIADQPVTGIDAVDRELIVATFADALPGWRWDGQILQPPEAEADGVPAFDVWIGDQLVQYTGYGWEDEHANAIIDVMHRLGYRLYDPQIDTRFA